MDGVSIMLIDEIIRLADQAHGDPAKLLQLLRSSARCTDRLLSLVEKMSDAVHPFVVLSSALDDTHWPDSFIAFELGGHQITVGDLRRLHMVFTDEKAISCES